MIKSLLLVVCFVLLSKTAFATKPFQGTITYSVVTDEEKGTISMATKGQKIKMEPHFGDSDGKVWMVINNSTQEMTIVMPEKYMYMDIEHDESNGQKSNARTIRKRRENIRSKTTKYRQDENNSRAQMPSVHNE